MSSIRIYRPDREDLESRGVFTWPVWEKEVSSFPWKYDDTEECYILEGRVEVTDNDGVVVINAGDFVVFPKGLSCHWNITAAVRKHYNFL